MGHSYSRISHLLFYLQLCTFSCFTGLISYKPARPLSETGFPLAVSKMGTWRCRSNEAPSSGPSRRAGPPVVAMDVQGCLFVAAAAAAVAAMTAAVAGLVVGDGTERFESMSAPGRKKNE